MTHISVEGMDGVGKSTVCELLASRTGYRFVDRPLRYLFSEDGDPELYIRIRDRVNSSPDRVFTSWFYGLSNIFLYERFGGEDIVTDRHMLSNYLWSGTDGNRQVYETLLGLIGAPDLTFLLYADRESIRGRLRSRDEGDPDLPKADDTEVAYSKMESFLREHDMPYLRIDSTGMRPDEVCDLMVAELERRGNIRCQRGSWRRSSLT